MWSWINENSAGLGVLFSLGTMIVWIAYFQILYRSFTRQRRTKILINRGVGSGIDSRCLISNMGAEPLYVVSIIAVLHVDDEQISAEVTDLDTSEVGEVTDAQEGTNQGPLMSGEFKDIGKFSELTSRCARANQRQAGNIEGRFDCLEIIVIGAYGAEDLSVGATRSFTLYGKDHRNELVANSVSTQQLRSRKERRRVERYLQNRLHPSDVQIVDNEA